MTENNVFSLAEILWNYHHLNQTLSKADFIVGLGSYDLRVADRCAELYFEHWAPRIVFTGYLGKQTQTLWNKSEAEMFTERCITKGVPAAVIQLEKKSTNTGENALFTKQMLAEINPPIKKIIVVTKPNTERRTLATFQKVWPEVEIIVTSPQLNLKQQINQQISEHDLINEIVGDLQRILLYPKLGYQIVQKVPQEVMQAYEKLINLGYDKSLINQETVI